jgi:hypothetical protein
LSISLSRVVAPAHQQQTINEAVAVAQAEFARALCQQCLLAPTPSQLEPGVRQQFLRVDREFLATTQFSPLLLRPEGVLAASEGQHSQVALAAPVVEVREAVRHLQLVRLAVQEHRVRATLVERAAAHREHGAAVVAVAAPGAQEEMRPLITERAALEDQARRPQLPEHQRFMAVVAVEPGAEQAGPEVAERVQVPY